MRSLKCTFKGTIKNDTMVLSKVVTGDETWCYGFVPEEKKYRANGKHWFSKNKKARQVRSNFKIILTCVFFYANGIVHMGFVPPDQTVNQQSYLKVLKILHDNVREKTRNVEQRWFVPSPRQFPFHRAFSLQ